MNRPSLIGQTIRELHFRKETLDQAIVALESLSNTTRSLAVGPTPQNETRSIASQRGRKSMPPAERAQVSVRMKKYWANRQK